MARISRGKFRYLRSLVAEMAVYADRFFKITPKNKSIWEGIMNEPLKVGDRIRMSHTKMTDAQIKAYG